MKIIVVIITTCFLQVSAAGLAQTISYSKKNATLEEVFKEIRKQTGYNVIAPAKGLRSKAPFNVHFLKTSLEEVMNVCVKGTDLTYRIQNKTIAVKQKDYSSPGRSSNQVDKITVIGNVFDKAGFPLPGASVTVKGKSQSVVTNANGMFEFRNVEQNAMLVISYIGYSVVETPAKPNLGIIELEKSDSRLDEIQLIAYGSTTKRLSTGAIGGITAAEIEMQPVLNPLEALKGRVAGVDITSASGIPGSGVAIRIRGQNSLRDDAVNPIQSSNMNAPITGSTPMYIVDGVPINSAGVGTNGTASILAFSAGINPLNSLNPADIENIQVLKDAAATSIYGSLGANGVVLITTKKGRQGQTIYDLNLSQGTGQVAGKMDLLNRRQYLDMRYEAYKNDGIDFNDPSVFDARDLKEWDTVGRDIDWQEELLGRSINYTNAQLSISGGNSGTSFRAGGGLQRQTSVFGTDEAYTKGSGNLSVAHRSTNHKFNANFSVLLNSDRNDVPGQDITLYALDLPPIGPSLYTPAGELNWADYPDHPLGQLQQKSELRTSLLTTSGVLGYQVFENLQFRTSFGYTRQEVKDKATFPSTRLDPAMLPYYGSSARVLILDENLNGTWSIEPQIEYNSPLGPGRFNVLLGSTFQKRSSQYNYLVAQGFSTDQQMNNRGLASELTTHEAQAEYRYSALFTRLSYNLSNKYILDLTARRDGSSRFAKGKQFGNFGALGAAWLFSEERLVADKFPVLSYGKLRLSYGTTGSDNIGDYMFLNTYNLILGVPPYDGISVIVPDRLPSDEYAWESTRKLDAELSLGFYKDRILITANYYRNESSNQLVGFPMPYTTGFPEITRNFPATVLNLGWEFSLNTANIKSKSFSWTSSLNLTLAKNRLVSYPDLDISPYAYRYAVGYSTNIVKVYDFIHVDPQTGLNVYRDIEGNPVSDPFNEIAEGNLIVDLSPRYFGGISNTFQLNRLSLDVFWQFGIRNGQLMPQHFSEGELGGMGNLSVHHFENRWRQPGDRALFPKLTTQLYTGNTSAAGQQNFGRILYARLSNVALSYTLAGALQKSLRTQNARVYLQGQNLLTISDYKGLDPETLASSLPPLRVFTFGLQLTF